MKNRIVSFLLAICMVVVAMPVFLLPLTAADGEPYVTTFARDTETWPTYRTYTTTELAPGDSRPYEAENFNQGWEVGYLDADGNYIRFDTFSNNDGIILSCKSSYTTGEWVFGGLYLQHSSGFAVLSKPFQAVEEENGTPIAADQQNKFANAVTYVSPYEGKATLDFATLLPTDTFMADGTIQSVMMAIFINGKMVWPTADGDYSTPAHWAKFIAEDDHPEETLIVDQFKAFGLDSITDININKGDTITFALAATGTSRYVKFEPRVTFAPGYSRFPSILNETLKPRTDEWPAYQSTGSGAKTLTQQSMNWKIGSAATGTSDFAAFGSSFKKGREVFACITGTDHAITGSVLLAANTSNVVGAIRFGTDGQYDIGYEYTAFATGKATIGFQDIALMEYNDGYVAATTGSVKARIYKNGTSLGEVVITAGETPTFPVADLVKGDRITILVAKDSANVAAVVATPLVKYTEIDSFMSATEGSLKIEDATPIVGDEFGVTFGAYAVKDVYLNYTEAGIYVWKGEASDSQTADNAESYPATLNDEYAFVADYTNLDAKGMADAITVQAWVKVGEQTILSDKVVTSVAEGVYDYYVRSIDKAEKEVLVAMLNYGAYAQIYFEHNTENLANKNLDASLTQMDDKILYYAKFDAKNNTNRLCNTEIEGFSLNVNNKIDLRVYVNIDPTEVDATTRKLQISTVTNDNGIVWGDHDITIGANGIAVIEDIPLTELSEVFYLRVAVKLNTPVAYYGYEFSYSIESYVARMVDSDPELGNMLRAMMEFGKAINANA